MKLLSCLIVWFVILQHSITAQQLGRSASRANHTDTKDIADKPAVKWQFKTGGSVVSSPVVNGRYLFIGSADSCMYALDRNSGQQLWKYKTGGAVNATVACDSTAVFFMSEDAHFYALDMHSGKLLWTFTTIGEHAIDPWDYFLSSAAVEKGIVYTGSTDGHIYALQAGTGKLLWKYRTGGAVHAAPTVVENTLLAGSFDGIFYALNTSNGALRWKFDTMGERYFPLGEVQFHAVVADSSVYFCSRDYNVYALHLRTGKGLWVYHEPGSWTSVPGMAGNRLLVSTFDTHRALAFDAYGNLEWKSPAHLNVFSSIATTNAYGYMGSLGGRLFKMNLRTGESTSIFQTAASKQTEGRFFDSATGELFPDLMARYKNDYIKMYADFLDMGSILSTPWLEDGMLFLGSTDGYVYALQ
ncbi:outer membrane protein assembly factor BamB family protein [Chitinophaga sp. 22321]|uniref:PQQ-binding-like beta-propeller repeat protein n=1 Tax=Chitinophaga hostae TaxID=2831022 RepID=A0ABS5J882_9BACT|nr:PQQ-binding-like beta-propeller repeat protein [Chitinophaga hostae]MBS0030782.1 PQQ-binding-like beta-propeller repeat protein [Chitinophaga hostae]